MDIKKYINKHLIFIIHRIRKKHRNSIKKQIKNDKLDNVNKLR